MGVVEHPQEVGVVVAQGHAGDLGVRVEEDVAVDVGEVVPDRPVVVREDLNGSGLLQINSSQGSSTTTRRLRNWSRASDEQDFN